MATPPIAPRRSLPARRSVFPLDVLPMATADLGPGSLAAFLGSPPGFAEDTVWFHPVFEATDEPENAAAPAL